MILDIIILVIVLFFLFNGFKNGLIYEVFGITKIFLTLILVLKYYSKIDMFLQRHNYKYSNIVVYIFSFIIIYIILSIIVYFIDKFLKVVKLGTFNSLLGGIFGFLKGTIFSIVIIVILIFVKDYNKKIQEIVENSNTAYYMSLYLKDFYPLFPEQIENKLKKFTMENKKIKLENEILNEIKKEITTNEVQ